jgi:hypothetical protein
VETDVTENKRSYVVTIRYMNRTAIETEAHLFHAETVQDAVKQAKLKFQNRKGLAIQHIVRRDAGRGNEDKFVA